MPFSKNTILLVEDDEFLAELYATKLHLEGFDVVIAGDGKKGLRLAKEKMPILILLDIVLPKMDGFDVLKQLKSDKNLRDIPVILLTNLSQKEEVQKGLKFGAQDYLIKAHFIPSEVVQKVKKIIKYQ